MLQVGGFSWEDCGNGRDPVVLQSLSVAPDPISIPGTLRISAAASSSKAMTSPLKVGTGMREGSKLHSLPGSWEMPGDGDGNEQSLGRQGHGAPSRPDVWGSEKFAQGIRMEEEEPMG